MFPSARPARRAADSFSAGWAGSPAGAELLARGRLRGPGRRPLPAILTEPCAATAPARSSQRCLISANAAALPSGRVAPLGRHPRAPRGRLSRPSPPGRGGGRWSPGGPRDSAPGKNYSTRRAAGEAAQGCPRLASAETGAAAAGETRGQKQRRKASVCLARQWRSEGPFGPFPASLHLSPGKGGGLR